MFLKVERLWIFCKGNSMVFKDRQIKELIELCFKINDKFGETAVILGINR